MKEEFDTTATKELICPYCGEEQEDAREAESLGESELFTCQSCTRDFVYSTETYLLYTSEDLEEHFSDRLMQEKLWLVVLQKDLERMTLQASGQDALGRVTRNIARSEDKIAKYQEMLRNYKLQEPCYASNCCGTSIIENTDLCSHCKEHCEAELLPNVITIFNNK